MLGSETETQEILKGLNNSLLRNINLKFLLFGNKKKILKRLYKFKTLNQAIEIIDCEAFISMTDKPSEILRTKTSSSMNKAIESVKDNLSDAVLSFGNTGALMSLALLNIKTLSQIKSPNNRVE